MELNYVTAAILGGFFSFIPSLLYNIIVIFCSYYVSIHYITDGYDKTKIANYIKNKYLFATSYSEKIKKPTGWIIGYNFLLYIPYDNPDVGTYTLFIIKKYFDEIYQDNNINSIDNISKPIRLLFKTRGRVWHHYHSIELHDRKINALFSYQNIIVNKIYSLFMEQRKVVVFVSGKIGTGKSMISDMLAAKINASETKDWNPSLPNQFFYNLVALANPTTHNPFLILLDEVDKLLDKIHNNQIRYHHPEYQTEIRNKSDWNGFLDDFNTKNPCKEHIFSNIIIFMTSNKSKREIDKMDPSYLREGRVDMFFDTGDF